MSEKNEPLTYTVELMTNTSDDLNALLICIHGMEMSSPEMRKANLNYLYDKYVTRAEPPNSEVEDDKN